ncbi:MULTISPECIES: UvrD-helicase domain-containing protein [unclassified Pseudomonas]|uniref:UvrD-helicase domain-containing protein n=1 Tax=unclassified Pseudomonas TaxID=196821 RepID=UPI001B331354|nr:MULTISPECIES: UvrD-helicase domain-containing protein [unclassified Pseudomonas]
MNPFDRARRQALETRETLVGLSASQSAVSSDVLLANVEDALDVAIERVPFGHSILGGGSGVLKRKDASLYIRSDVVFDEQAYLIAHELGHWYLDDDRPEQTIAHLNAITASHGSQATVAIDTYGARERTELQANVFARELLLPRVVAKQQFLAGVGARVMATNLKVPLEVVRQQLFDGLLLPILPSVPVSPLPPMTEGQRVAAMASETFVNVVAGPGTGKTTTLIHRIKHLIEQGVEPSKILVLTFTNKAANELVERLTASAIAGAASVWTGTFHAFGLEFLRKHHHLFGLDSDICVADKLMQVRLMVRTLATVKLKYYLRLQNPYDWLPAVIEQIKRLKEECLTVDEYRARLLKMPQCEPDIADQREDIATLFEAYEQGMRDEKWVDYTDLVAFPSIQSRRDRSSVSQHIDQFEHVLVDEYQDVTEVMVDLVRQLALNAKSVWVVGDVRQAIHHWRGSSIKSLIEFDDTFHSNVSGATCRRYALDLNRRSTPEILSLFSCAGRVHALQDRMPLEPVSSYRASIGEVPKLYQCSSKPSQAATIAARVKSLMESGVAYRDQLVISRSSADVEEVVEALAARGVPVLHVGDICQRPEIKRLLCLMELLCMRQPRSLVGLMQDPAFPMTAQDIELLMHITRKGSGTQLQRGRWIWLPIMGLSSGGQQAKANLAMLLSGFTRNTKPWNFVSTVLLDRRYGFPNPADLSIQAHTARLALWLFVYAVRNGDGDASQSRLSQFLLREELRRRIDEKLADRGLPPEARALDAVNVMTVHSSKGLEYQAVHLTNVDDTAYGPNRPYYYDYRALELLPPEVLNSSGDEFEREEKVERNNLLYVALSRARDYLNLYQLEDSRRPQPLNVAGAGCLLVRNGIHESPPVRRPLPVSNSTAMPTVSYEAMQTYFSCPLQFHYRHELSLTAEQEIDVSIRARWVVMDMLLAVVKEKADPATAFRAAWKARYLPTKEEDEGLYQDAVVTAKRGLNIVRSVDGVLVEGMVSEIQGVRIELPWMLARGGELHWIRAQGGAKTSLGHLRPMMLDINDGSVSYATVYSLITNQQLSDGVSKKPESTAMYKMAKRFAAGDRSPSKGKQCGRCAYLSICDSRP